MLSFQTHGPHSLPDKGRGAARGACVSRHRTKITPENPNGACPMLQSTTGACLIYNRPAFRMPNPFLQRSRRALRAKRSHRFDSPSREDRRGAGRSRSPTIAERGCGRARSVALIATRLTNSTPPSLPADSLHPFSFFRLSISPGFLARLPRDRSPWLRVSSLLVSPGSPCPLIPLSPQLLP